LKEYPLTIYSTILTDSGHSFEIPGLADHGYLYLDGIYQGNLTNVFSGSFTKKLKIDGLEAKNGQKLEIIVEHIGRLLFPLAELDHKAKIGIKIFLIDFLGNSFPSFVGWTANSRGMATLWN
jgi:hypothetical protein